MQQYIFFILGAFMVSAVCGFHAIPKFITSQTQTADIPLKLKRSSCGRIPYEDLAVRDSRAFAHIILETLPRFLCNLIGIKTLCLQTHSFGYKGTK